jgi:hypothetical protein
MIELALIASLSSAQIEERINKTCAYIVGIPYASDNFSDREWERFVVCKNLMKRNFTHKIR